VPWQGHLQSSVRCLPRSVQVDWQPVGHQQSWCLPMRLCRIVDGDSVRGRLSPQRYQADSHQSDTGRLAGQEAGGSLGGGFAG